jgi:hypothetical protein
VENTVTRQALVDYYAELNFCVPEEHEQVKLLFNLVFSWLDKGNLEISKSWWICQSIKDKRVIADSLLKSKGKK